MKTTQGISMSLIQSGISMSESAELTSFAPAPYGGSNASRVENKELSLAVDMRFVENKELMRVGFCRRVENKELMRVGFLHFVAGKGLIRVVRFLGV